MKNFALSLFSMLMLCSCNDRTVPTGNPRPTSANAKTKDTATDSFLEIVQATIKGFRLKDDTELAAITDDSLGVIVVYRNGVFNEYKRLKKIDFNIPYPHGFSYPEPSKPPKLQYDNLPRFNCGTMEWNRHGLYCDTIRQDTLLSGVPINLQRYRGDSIAASEIKSLRTLEAKSRRVVLAAPSGSLIFYLTRIDGRWYFSAIDMVTTDCSA